MPALSKALILLLVAAACNSPYRLTTKPPSQGKLSGSQFYKMVASWKWKERDSLAVKEILEGNIPSFLKTFVRINTSIEGNDGKKISAHYYVMPDYLSVGNNDDWARVPLTPMAAQKIADSFHCFLSTSKIADDIYRQAKVKLEPVPMYAFRDSSPTMWQHHLIIEGQRKGKKGLIAGIKKDVIISGKTTLDAKKDRVAIYGWHMPDGNAIQPIYTGHINWYVDYSHGIRLVYKTIYINGKAMDYTDVMKHPQLHKLICNEAWCDVYRY